jgi:hypothetical protein
MNTLDEISKIISWWIGLEKGFTDIEMLNYTQQKLSGYSYYLAEQAAEMKQEYNKGYYMRKINISKSKNAYINQKKSATHAESLALIDHKSDYENEIKNEALAHRLDLLLKQVNHILAAIQQRISYLKQEMQHSRNINNI